MTKYILTSAAALALLVAPISVSAQTNNDAGTTTKSQDMKGPPNADGMQKGDTSNTMQFGRSEDSNGAASAKATGEDKAK
jgi:Spy/CpxP family protein refolding chaperone